MVFKIVLEGSILNNDNSRLPICLGTCDLSEERRVRKLLLSCLEYSLIPARALASFACLVEIYLYILADFILQAQVLRHQLSTQSQMHINGNRSRSCLPRRSTWGSQSMILTFGAILTSLGHWSSLQVHSTPWGRRAKALFISLISSLVWYKDATEPRDTRTKPESPNVVIKSSKS